MLAFGPMSLCFRMLSLAGERLACWSINFAPRPVTRFQNMRLVGTSGVRAQNRRPSCSSRFPASGAFLKWTLLISHGERKDNLSSRSCRLLDHMGSSTGRFDFSYRPSSSQIVSRGHQTMNLRCPEVGLLRGVAAIYAHSHVRTLEILKKMTKK